MAAYEGASFKAVGASGRICPLCGGRARKCENRNGKRIYECGECGVKLDMDFAACWNLVRAALERLGLGYELDPELLRKPGMLGA